MGAGRLDKVIERFRGRVEFPIFHPLSESDPFVPFVSADAALLIAHKHRGRGELDFHAGGGGTKGALDELGLHAGILTLRPFGRGETKRRAPS